MKRICIALIRFYQKFLSPLKVSCCRFTPTCSRYAIEAVARFGVIKGILLSGYRILRCNPFFSGGYDPVPFRFTFSGKQLPRVTLNTSVSDTSAFFSDNK